MKNKKRTCSICGKELQKIKDPIKQCGYSYYLECPDDCLNRENYPKDKKMKGLQK